MPLSTELSNPYVAIRKEQQPAAQAMSHEMRTPFIPHTLNPEWTAGNQFQLSIADGDRKARLFCHVYDADGKGTPDYLGGVAVPLDGYIEATAQSGITAFDLGASPEPLNPEPMSEGPITGRLFLSLQFEPRTLAQQKHPLGWLEVSVLSAHDEAQSLPDAESQQPSTMQAKENEGSSSVPDRQERGDVVASPSLSFVELRILQPGPTPQPDSTPCVAASANGDTMWTADNDFVYEVWSTTASLVLQLRDKVSTTEAVQNLHAMISRTRSSITSDVRGEIQLPLRSLVTEDAATGPIEKTLQLGQHLFVAANMYKSSEAGHFDDHGKFVRPDEGTTTNYGFVKIRLEWKKWVPPPPPIGELLVKVIKADGLRRADILSHNDTYVKLWLEQAKGSDAVAYKKHRTATIQDVQDPDFSGSVFTLRVRDEDAKLVLQAWDEDSIGTDDFLGEAVHGLAEFIRKPGIPKILKLKMQPMTSLSSHTEKTSAVSGSVSCELVFKKNPEGYDEVDEEKLALVEVKSIDDDWDAVPQSRVTKRPRWCTTVAIALLVCSILAAVMVGILLLVQSDSVQMVLGRSNLCTADRECSAPAGACIDGACSCQMGFTGNSCNQRTLLLSPTVSVTSELTGAVDSLTFRDSVARLQAGITPDDVYIDSIEQTVEVEIIVPGPPQDFDSIAQSQMAEALVSAVPGVTQADVSGMNATTVSGRRQLQLIAASAVHFIFTAYQDTSPSWRNMSDFAASFAVAAAQTCAACTNFDKNVVLPSILEITTIMQYRIAPVLSSRAEADQMASALMDMISAAQHDEALMMMINEVAQTTLVESVVSTVLPAFVSQAFTRLGGDVSIFEQLTSVIGSKNAASFEAQELSFGGWRLQVEPAPTDDQCAVATVRSSMRLGDMLQDANSTLADGVLAALSSMMTSHLVNVSITACPTRALIHLDGTMLVYGTATELQLTANKIDELWQYTLVTNATAALRALQASLGDFVNSFQVPTNVCLVVSALHSDGELRSSFNIGSVENGNSVLSLRDAGTIHQQITEALSDGITGTFEFRGRTVSMRMTADSESGLRFGAILLETPMRLVDVFRPVISEIQDLLGPGHHAISTLLGDMLAAFFEVEVSNLLFAATSVPPSLSLTGSVTWRSSTVNFDARLSAEPWRYAILFDIPDLSDLLNPQALGLGDFGLENINIVGSPSVMVASSDVSDRLRFGSWTADRLVLIPTNVQAMQELAIAQAVSYIHTFASEAISDGLNGTISYHGRTVALYCKSDAQKGIIFGADVSGDPINVAQTLGAALSTVRAGLLGDEDERSSETFGVVLAGLSDILDLDVDNLALHAHTSPHVTVHVGGDLTWRNISSNVELFVSQRPEGWDWAFSTSQDPIVLLSLLEPVQEFVAGMTPASFAFSVMVSSDSVLPIRIGEPPATRHVGIDISRVFDMHGFLEERLHEGFRTSIDIGGVSVLCVLRSTTGGLYLSATANLPPPIPMLRDFVLTPDLSNLPAEVQATFSTFLSTGIVSLGLDIWTGGDAATPAVIFTGELQVSANLAKFVFTAERPSSSWNFDLAVETDLSEYLWSRLDFNQIPDGIQSTFGITPQPPNALQTLALKVGYDDSGPKFEIGALIDGIQNAVEQTVSVMSLPSDFVDPFSRGIELPNIQLGSIEVDLFLYASAEDMYASVSVPLASASTLTDSLASALDFNIATAVDSGIVPVEFQDFTEHLRETSLQNFRCHIYTDGSLTKSSVAGLVAGTALESLAFQAATNQTTWSLVTSFDVGEFLDTYFSSLDFLSLERRRCQENGTMPAFLLKQTPESLIASIGETSLSPDSLLTPTPTAEGVPGIAEVCRHRPCTKGETLQPLSFGFGATTVDVSIEAEFITEATSEASNNVAVQISVENLTLADVLLSMIPSSSFGDDCGIGSAELARSSAASALYCSLLTVLGHVNLRRGFLRAMAADTAEWNAELELHSLSFGHGFAMDLHFLAAHSDGETEYGARLHFEGVSFEPILRSMSSLSIAGTHICDLPVSSTMCQISLPEMSLFYASSEEACSSLAGTQHAATMCYGDDENSEGIFLRTRLIFPPQFEIDLGFATFATDNLQAAITSVIGTPVPTVSVNLFMKMNPETRSMRMKVALAEIFAGSDSGTPSGMRNTYGIGTNPEGGDLLTLTNFAAMLEISSAGLFPGLMASCRVDLAGFESSASGEGISPEQFEVDISMLTGMKMCLGVPSPFFDIDLLIEPAVTWQNPFGTQDLSLTLGRLGGGLCVSAGVPVPTRLGFYGGFSWGAPVVLSGWAYIELSLEAVAASQFFYGELVCTLQPCNLRTVVDTMITTGLPDTFAMLEELTLECSDPNCRAWINMRVSPPMIVTAGDPKIITNPQTQEDITVPGGLGLSVPGFTLMGLTGYADINLGTTSGYVNASLRGPFSPASASCLTIGSPTDYISTELSYDVPSLQFNLDMRAHIGWGDVDMAASLSLHTHPNPRFALSLSMFVPLLDECNLDFAIEAEAEASLGGSGPLGISGSFSFGNTHFNTEVFGCLCDAVAGRIDEAWDSLLGGWGDEALQWLDDMQSAIHDAVAEGYNNPYGQCHKTPGMMQTLCSDNSDCQPNADLPNHFGSYGCGNPHNGHGAHCECDTEGCNTCRCIPDSMDIETFLRDVMPDAPDPGDPHRFDPPGQSRNCHFATEGIGDGLSQAAQGVVDGANAVGDAVGEVGDAVGDAVGAVGDFLGRRLNEDGSSEHAGGVAAQRLTSRFPHISASAGRLRALLSRSEVKYGLQLWRDFPAKTEALMQKYRTSHPTETTGNSATATVGDAGSAGGRRRLNFGLDDIGNSITELTTDLADAIDGLANFFEGLGDVSLLEVRDIVLGGSSLCDILEFGTVEANVSFEVTLFGNVCMGDHCITPIEQSVSLSFSFDPAALWESMKNAIIEWVDNYLQENLNIEALWNELTG